MIRIAPQHSKHGWKATTERRFSPWSKPFGPTRKEFSEKGKKLRSADEITLNRAEKLLFEGNTYRNGYYTGCILCVVGSINVLKYFDACYQHRDAPS